MNEKKLKQEWIMILVIEHHRLLLQLWEYLRLMMEEVHHLIHLDMLF